MTQTWIDLRSDTVTQPTEAMRQAMLLAPTGDDVYEEDPTVNRLQAELAAMFGMEAGLFCPSGTMTNQIAIKLHTHPQDEVICHWEAHIHKYEAGGIAFNSQVSVKLLSGEFGKITAQQVADHINPDNIHYPATTLVGVENTANRGGGSCYSLAEIEAIAAVCREKNLKYHLDGARIFNALIANREQARSYGQVFDTISVCLSKGLGCPIGSVLLGKAADIRKAKRIRKVLGGAMRQAGMLAAAGLFALENHIDRLAEDHYRAQALAQALQTLPWVKTVFPCPTNIVIFHLHDAEQTQALLAYLKQQGILASAIDKTAVRLVTHLDFDDNQLQTTLHTLQQFSHQPVSIG